MEPNETSQDPASAARHPSTISPSAYALLMMKSHTSIPYAREAAALIDPAQHNALSEKVDPVDYWTRVMHFESRYQTINQLLEDLTATNILEISSGFSFRGLDLSNKKPVFYIDTDLPNIIAGKQRLIDALTTPPSSEAPANPGNPPGHYELQPLDALDPAAFEAVVNKFPPGPLTIVNEGLLVYLDRQEKAQLCANIRKALLARSGHWITADIYIKREGDDLKNDAWQKWSREHKLEDNKFAGFEEAKEFFHSMGFEIEKEATQDYSRLTSFQYFSKAAGPEGLKRLRQPGRSRVHTTWRLTPKP